MTCRSCLARNTPWSHRFDEAMQVATHGRLANGRRPADGAGRRRSRFAGDLARSGGARGWLADNPGCIEALHRYAAFRAGEKNGLEDAD